MFYTMSGRIENNETLQFVADGCCVCNVTVSSLWHNILFHITLHFSLISLRVVSACYLLYFQGQNIKTFLQSA